jgi:hypothetical protein
MRLRFAFLAFGLVLLALATAPRTAWGLGEETLGNEPLAEANYAQWKGLVAVVNDPCRVYYSWVNGNENMYFEGDTDKLNAALAAYAASDVEEREVILRPGPGETKSFEGQEFTFQWHLQIFGGIAAHLTKQEFGDHVWNKHPRMTVYVGGDIDLAKLNAPKGVKLLDITAASARARKGIESKDQSVRGWSAGVIAHLDAHDPENQKAVEKLLADKENWVRLNAAGAIPLFGQHAKSALPALKACLESDDKGLKEAAQRGIEKIEAAPDPAAADKEYQAAVARIQKFVSAQK